MEARYPGRSLRTRDAIQRTGLVVVGTLVEPGTVTLGPPGASRIDRATFNVEQVLTPSAGGTTPPGRYALSYIRQTLPESSADSALRRGERYVLFCTVMPGKRLDALKVVPYSDEAGRIVASAFSAGARHTTEA